jgi:hypothetical protein
MPQTLLALLALVLASFLSFNQQRLSSRSHQNMVSSELELAATGLASEVIEMIGARAFDRSTAPGRIEDADGVVPTTPAGFAPASTFGTSAYCDLLTPADGASCNDVDDLHGGGWRPARVDLAHGRYLDFEVRTQVFYVSSAESMAPAPAPTLHKRVVMDIRTDLVPSAPDGILRVTRVISYDPIKASRDHEAWREKTGLNDDVVVQQL